MTPIDTSTEAAEAEVEKLRGALRPFAEYIADGGDRNYNGEPLPDTEGMGWVYLTIGDFRRARAALTRTDAAHVNETPKSEHVRADVLAAVGAAPAPVRGVVMAEKLKPCPFCGGDDLYFPHGTDPAVIECSGCGARSGVPDDQTQVEATAKWNVRVAPSLRITGPNSDGEYWLHINAGGRSGGVNLGGEHGPICKRILDAASETGAKE